MFWKSLIDFQGDESATETKQDKPKQDDPVVDLFPDDDAEERSSKWPELFVISFILMPFPAFYIKWAWI
jgi:hypothetical protein